MTARVLIIGGYGNFGSYISMKLAQEDFKVIIAGRSLKKCEKLIRSINDATHEIEFHVFDFTKTLPLDVIKPNIVIHTSGPFQDQNYDVAKACIEYGCHYIDLSDGRDFVSNISSLNDEAIKKGITIISGASSVPCLSSAVIDAYIDQFYKLHTIEYGIATAQQTNRGYATTAAIFGYTGKSFKTLINGNMEDIYGWQDLHFYKYPEFGYRGLCNCEIPDLELFPKYYPDLKTIRFFAGTEIKFMQIGLWMLSWLVRFKIISSLKPAANIFIKIAHSFDWLGSSNSAFHMKLKGSAENGEYKEKTIYILAKEGDGPFIPCAPAIILARKLAFETSIKSGSFPCVGLIDLIEYMRELAGLNIQMIEE